MEFKAQEIAELIGGVVEGDPGVMITNLSKIEEGAPGTMTFLSNKAYTQYIYTTMASVAIVNRDFIPQKPLPEGLTLIRVDNAYMAFARLLELQSGMEKERTGVSSLAFISPSAVFGNDCYIGEFAVIGENAVIGDKVQIYPQVYIGDHVKIGSGTVLYPGVRIYRNCEIGKECTIHGGAVIGSDGFGFARQEDKNFKKIPQIGNVILEDFVEIGANTTIDRATMGSTVIRKGVKLDNLIQVGHNVEIGENTVIAGLTGIAGSAKIGKNCMLAGQVGLVGHIVISDDVIIGAQSGVENSVTQPGLFVLGSPAIDASRARRSYVHWRNFDDIVRKLNTLEKKFKKLFPDE